MKSDMVISGRIGPERELQWARTHADPGEDAAFARVMSGFTLEDKAIPPRREEDSPVPDGKETPANAAQPPWCPPSITLVPCAGLGADGQVSGTHPDEDSVKLTLPKPSPHERLQDKIDTTAAEPNAHLRLPVSNSAEGPDQRQAKLAVMIHSQTHAQIDGIEMLPERTAEEPQLKPAENADGSLSSSVPATSAAPGMPFTTAAATPDSSAAQQIISRLFRRVPDNDADIMRRGEIKILRMKLRPDELGDVEVVLRHTGQETRIHITVSREAAAETLRRDLGLLEDRLGPLLTGNSSRAITISVEAESQPQVSGFAQDTSGFGSGSSFGTQAEAEGRRSSPDKKGMPFVRKMGDRDDEALPLHRSASGLVV